jgi:hypothetical protein
VADEFGRLIRLADLPPITLHGLRHGAATLALAAGVDLKAVQHMLRHSSITVTIDLYTNVLQEVAADAARKLAGASRVSRCSRGGSLGLPLGSRLPGSAAWSGWKIRLTVPAGSLNGC